MQGSAMPRVLQPGFRLVTSVIAAIVVFVASRPWLPNTGSRVVLVWDTGVAVLLCLIAIMMWRTEPSETSRRARKEETSNILILFVTILAVAGALVDIGYDLPKTKTMSQTLRVFAITESVIGVFLAWLLLHVMYSLHYAKLYYSEIDTGPGHVFRKGLVFPGSTDLDYWDFVYYSLTIAMCFQTSDITINSAFMRRVTIFHATVSYLFALVILGLLLDGFLVNIA
jgi:uncharacterized membrane protein